MPESSENKAKKVGGGEVLGGGLYWKGCRVPASGEMQPSYFLLKGTEADQETVNPSQEVGLNNVKPAA